MLLNYIFSFTWLNLCFVLLVYTVECCLQGEGREKGDPDKQQLRELLSSKSRPGSVSISDSVSKKDSPVHNTSPGTSSNQWGPATETLHHGPGGPRFPPGFQAPFSQEGLRGLRPPPSYPGAGGGGIRQPQGWQEGMMRPYIRGGPDGQMLLRHPGFDPRAGGQYGNQAQGYGPGGVVRGPPAGHFPPMSAQQMGQQARMPYVMNPSVSS